MVATSNKKNRLKIPQVAKIKAILQQEIDSACPFCSSKEVGHFEIHHIDDNPANNEYGNLILVCPTCHSKITKNDIKSQEVIDKKLLLQKAGTLEPKNKYTSKDIFLSEISLLINDKNSLYYLEIKQHWNCHSLIKDSTLLADIINKNLSKSINFGILLLIADSVTNHLYYDKASKYIYNQPHKFMRTSEGQGYNLPVYYHIRFVGILYATAIENSIDIGSLSRRYSNMNSIYSCMIEGMIDNLDLGTIDDKKEYPTNYHWLIGEILSTARYWLEQFNEAESFNEESSYLSFIPFSISLCLSELYKAIGLGKISEKFLIRQIYWSVIHCYFFSQLNEHIRKSIDENIISLIPDELIEPILSFSLDEAFAIWFVDFRNGEFRNANNLQGGILNQLRDFLISKGKI